MSKYVQILDYIWNHHENCIQISTNMPDIGLESCEILKISERKQFCINGETNGRMYSVNITMNLSTTKNE